MEALGALGFALLIAVVAVHVATVVALVRGQSPGRGALALFLPPLAVAWGWQLGARRRIVAYISLLGAFALVVVAIRLMR